jgi:hypothetical protein
MTKERERRSLVRRNCFERSGAVSLGGERKQPFLGIREKKRNAPRSKKNFGEEGLTAICGRPLQTAGDKNSRWPSWTKRLSRTRGLRV